MKYEKPYVISQDRESGVYYCHMRGYPYIPVFGSIGDKAKAKRVCDIYNQVKKGKVIKGNGT